MRNSNDKDTVRTLYIVLGIGSILPVMTLLAAIFACFAWRKAEPMMQSHYLFIVRTVLIGLPFQLGGILLVWYLNIGWMILLAWFLWLIARCYQGFRIASAGLPHPHPRTFAIY